MTKANECENKAKATMEENMTLANASRSSDDAGVSEGTSTKGHPLERGAISD